jgi:hypothetical protein
MPMYELGTAKYKDKQEGDCNHAALMFWFDRPSVNWTLWEATNLDSGRRRASWSLG